MLEIADKAIQFELNNVVDNNDVISLKRSEDSKTVSPYLFTGTAGLVAVLVRFYKLTGKEKYKTSIDQLSEDIIRKYSYTPGYCNGLSGIGMVLIDCYHYLHEEKFIKGAWRIYNILHLYSITKDSGIAFPGELLLKLSNDFATGSIGIATYYQRLINPDKCHDFFLDEIIEEAKNEFL